MNTKEPFGCTIHYKSFLFADYIKEKQHDQLNLFHLFDMDDKNPVIDGTNRENNVFHFFMFVKETNKSNYCVSKYVRYAVTNYK